MTMPGQPYQNSWDDGEGDVYDPQHNRTDNFLAAWYTRGYTAHLGANGEMVYTPLIASTPANTDYASLPSAIGTYTEIHQQYFNPDHDPLGGFLTFMPSDSFTYTADGVSYRVPRRLSGTETWPSLDSGVSPWAFSMEGSGCIYIWLGFLVVKLFPTDIDSIVTDSGNPLTYHVIEHFQEGREFDITVPSSDTALDLTADCMIDGSMRPYQFDPVNPLGMLDALELQSVTTSSPPATVRTYLFPAATNLWVATHNFPYLPSVTCVDDTGHLIEGTVSYPTSTTVHVEWASSVSGKMELR